MEHGSKEAWVVSYSLWRHSSKPKVLMASNNRYGLVIAVAAFVAEPLPRETRNWHLEYLLSLV